MSPARPDLAAIMAQLAQALADLTPAPTQPEPSIPPERILLTVEETAQRLGIGRSMAYRLIRDRAIESVQIGRLRRVPIGAVQAYAAQLVATQADTPHAA